MYSSISEYKYTYMFIQIRRQERKNYHQQCLPLAPLPTILPVTINKQTQIQQKKIIIIDSLVDEPFCLVKTWHCMPQQQYRFTWATLPNRKITARSYS